MGLHLLFGDGEVGAVIPVSAGDDFIVSLADVRNTRNDDFQPSDPTLFNSALSSVSASLSQEARSASAGSAFLRAKRRESLLPHTSIPVPEAQRRSLTVAPGSSGGLFNEDILAEVVAQVQHSSLISSNLAVSRSLGRGRSRPSSSSPLVDPHSSE